jgi:hypothetical protein
MPSGREAADAGADELGAIRARMDAHGKSLPPPPRHVAVVESPSSPPPPPPPPPHHYTPTAPLPAAPLAAAEAARALHRLLPRTYGVARLMLARGGGASAALLLLVVCASSLALWSARRPATRALIGALALKLVLSTGVACESLSAECAIGGCDGTGSIALLTAFLHAPIRTVRAARCEPRGVGAVRARERRERGPRACKQRDLRAETDPDPSSRALLRRARALCLASCLAPALPLPLSLPCPCLASAPLPCLALNRLARALARARRPRGAAARP